MNRVLLNACQKTGQHWLLFVLANYHKILTENIQKPLLWKELSYFGRTAKGISNAVWDNKPFVMKESDFCPGFPYLMRSEANWNKLKEFHESFDKVIYLCRNPFDVMVSLWNYHNKKDTLWKIIKNTISNYIIHLNEGYHKADIVLKYEELKENPHLFKEAFLLFYDTINENTFQTALKYGGFEYIHSIAPTHARKGTVGQYKDVMDNEMIVYIKKRLKKNLKYTLYQELKIDDY